jgi:hypothetical protein
MWSVSLKDTSCDVNNATYLNLKKFHLIVFFPVLDWTMKITMCSTKGMEIVIIV